MPDSSQFLLKVEKVWIKKRKLSFKNWKPWSFEGKDLLFLQIRLEKTLFAIFLAHNFKHLQYKSLNYFLYNDDI